MSFWKESPGPHWSDWISSALSCSGVALAQPIRRFPLALAPPSDVSISYSLAESENAAAIAKFLSEQFQITAKSVCCLPVERLARGILSDWIAVIARDKANIVGTIISRPLGSVLFQSIVEKEPKQSKFSSADYIDFFCVHPDYRKSGIGSELLKNINFYASERGRPIHFFQKELTPLFALPPLWFGTYIFREAIQSGAGNSRIQHFSNPKKLRIKNEFQIAFASQRPSQDSRYYINDAGNFKIHLAITNTYHMYQNSWLGEVLFYSLEEADDNIEPKNIAAAIEEIIENSGYRYILMDESIPHLKQFNWIRDASYYVYAYNINPRHFFTVKPNFWF
jgi:GNAT superfamily N-acetyltransferase